MKTPRAILIIWVTVAASAVCLAVFSASARAALEEQPVIYHGIRSQGMGGIVTTTGNYGEALFNNPARLSEVDVSKFTLIELQTEVNTTLLSTESNLSNIKSSSGSNVIASASGLIGENEHLAFQMMSAYYNPAFIGDLGFGFGLIASAETNLLVNYTTDIDTVTLLDVGPNFGFSYPFLDHSLSLGLNIHFIYRVSATGTIDSLNFLTGSKLSLQNFGHQGYGVDADLGAYYHIPWELPFMRIAVGMSLNGLAKSHYSDINAALMPGVGLRPANNDRLINTGFRFDFPDWWWFTAPIFAFEFHDVGDTTTRSSFAKKTHFGTEARLSRVFSLRLGINQGYLTAGLGIDLPVVKIDFSTYGEELTGNAGNFEDRRLAFRLAFEL